MTGGVTILSIHPFMPNVFVPVDSRDGSHFPVVGNRDASKIVIPVARTRKDADDLPLMVVAQLEKSGRPPIHPVCKSDDDAHDRHSD